MYDLTTEELQYLPAGIHQNVKLLKIAKEPSKKDGTGQTVLRFFFIKEEESDKYYYTFTAFPIDPDKVAERNQNKPNSKYSDQQAIVNEFIWFSNKIKHILGTFVPKDKLVFKVNEKDPEKAWELFCDKVIEIAGEAFVGHSFECKLVLDGNDRAGFPKYAFNPFIKNMMNTTVKLAIDPNYERIVPVVKEEENSEEWLSQDNSAQF